MCLVGDRKEPAVRTVDDTGEQGGCLMKQGPRGAEDLVSRDWSEKSPGSRVFLKLINF